MMLEFPSGKFDVILADPPWRYNFSRSKSRSIEAHYPSMNIKDIQALGSTIPTTDNCVLFLWATAPKLPEALSVIEAWGFKLRTGILWDKIRIGMGYYFRSRHEHLLVVEKGQPPQPIVSDDLDLDYGIVIQVKRDNKHSKKPDVTYEIIEKLYPNRRYLELFARNETIRPGWCYWGNEATVTLSTKP
jgi:N6-adenosine-specific RNA methylase IME4